jgi:photosystem II stability/assembly factor-like uncharacterized protein
VNCVLAVGSNIYAGLGSGVFVSTDNGASWTLKNTGLSSSPFIYTITSNGNKIYAGSASGKAVWVSANNGDTWDSLRTNLPAFCQVFASTTANGIVYISESGSGPGSIYKLDSSSNAWISDTVGLNSFGFFPALGKNEDGSKLYIVSGFGGVVFVKNLGGTGVQKIASSRELELYPNPAQNLVHIQSPGFNGKTQVAVFDLSGKLVLETMGLKDIDLGNLATGSYILEISDAEGSARKLFVKE